MKLVELVPDWGESLAVATPWGVELISLFRKPETNLGETWANYTKSYITSSMADAVKNEFTLWNSAYLQRASTKGDAEPEEQRA